MSSLRATICAASVLCLGLVAPLSAVADTSTSLKPASVDPAYSIAATKGSAAVKLDGCTLTGRNGRSASFSSKMVAGSSAASIELRYDLFTRPISGGEWKAVEGVQKFGAWDRPSSSSVVWSKSVGGLTVGQSYRVLVTHRWLSKSGRVIRRNVIASPACDQHDARADLAASFNAARATNQTAALNEFLTYTETTALPDKMLLIAASEYQALEASRLCNIPPFLLGISTGSYAYQSSTQSRADLYLFGVKPYADCIAETLSGNDVVPRGTFIDFDTETYLMDNYAVDVADDATPTDAITERDGPTYA